ncbi:MAG: hypothetical protein JEZ08_11700 [Clostridiales bacterium]|nr:hypothetical protein [Clostridiales bacterium]
MKTLIKRSVSIMMVVVCLMGTAVFADTEGQCTQEIMEMEVCKAIDILGGIPKYIQGPDREDLEVMLSNIDEYTAAGLYDQANAIWESVYELIAPYKEQFGDNFENDNESMNDEEYIQEQIQKLEERIMRYEGIGDYASADELRAELEKLLMAVYGEEDPDSNNNQGEDDFDMDFSQEAIDRIIEEVEAEIERLEQAGDFEAADALRNELEVFLNEQFGEKHHEGFDGELSPEDMKMVEELEAEIGRLEKAGDFEAAETLRNELDEILNGYFGEHHEQPDVELSPDDVKMIIQETEAEIENLERMGDFEAADNLRRELEEFMNQHNDEFHEEPEGENDFGQGFLSLEEILSRAGHDLSPGQLAILSYLVNEINEVVSE